MVKILFASVVATVVATVLIYVNNRVAVVPGFDLLDEIIAFNTRVGLPATVQAAWVTHALIGVLVWGTIYGFVEPVLPKGGILSGIVFGFIAWLVMMIGFMPLAGEGIFAQNLPQVVLLLTLGMHILFGIVLSITYAALVGDGS